MKNLAYSLLLALAFGSTSAFAHHMAVDMVDEETYEMIDQNLIDADSPHLDLVLEEIQVGMPQ